MTFFVIPSAQSPYDAWRSAEALFGERDYLGAARLLETLLSDGDDHGRHLAQVRELLVRSYYHSARLDKAVEAARTALTHEPNNAYLILLLGRSLERRGDKEEAASQLRLAAALGLEV